MADSSFYGTNGSSEHFFLLEGKAGLSFEDQLSYVGKRYDSWRQKKNLSEGSLVFLRLFLSDILNQFEELSEKFAPFLSPGEPTAISIIQQPSLKGAKVSLLAYHIGGDIPINKTWLDKGHILVEHGRQRTVWSTQLSADSDSNATISSDEETRIVFDSLTRMLKSQNCTLADHCIRTWFYVKEIDVFYKGMVDARNNLFKKQGLTEDTHYIASTGIEGSGRKQYSSICLDAISLLDIKPEQITYLKAEDYLCPTKQYQVAFERGTCVSYADRKHFYISGTASINREGKVVHCGDVIRQADRALMNVEALLHSSQAGLDDLKYLLVYLRDPSDYKKVAAYMQNRFPDLPYLIVQGRVCRPEWLIEFEGIAITHHDAPALPVF